MFSAAGKPALFVTVRREIVQTRRETGEHAGHSSVFTIAAEAFMNNAG